MQPPHLGEADEAMEERDLRSVQVEAEGEAMNGPRIGDMTNLCPIHLQAECPSNCPTDGKGNVLGTVIPDLTKVLEYEKAARQSETNRANRLAMDLNSQEILLHSQKTQIKNLKRKIAQMKLERKGLEARDDDGRTGPDRLMDGCSDCKYEMAWWRCSHMASSLEVEEDEKDVLDGTCSVLRCCHRVSKKTGRGCPDHG